MLDATLGRVSSFRCILKPIKIDENSVILTLSCTKNMSALEHLAQHVGGAFEVEFQGVQTEITPPSEDADETQMDLADAPVEEGEALGADESNEEITEEAPAEV